MIETRVVWLGIDPRDEVNVRRGRCWCGTPIALEYTNPFGQVFSHGEVALACSTAEMLYRNDRCLDQHAGNRGVCLLADLLSNVHS